MEVLICLAMSLLVALTSGSSYIPGGKITFEPTFNDAEVNLGLQLLNDYLAKTEFTYQYRSGVRVVKATKQILIHTTLYDFTLEVSGGRSGENEICSFEVISVPAGAYITGEVDCENISDTLG